MKYLNLFLLPLLGVLFFCACSDDAEKPDYNKSNYAKFIKQSITIGPGASQVGVIVEWDKATWEITAGEGDILKDFQPVSGGNANEVKQFTKVYVTCQANVGRNERSQNLYLVDKVNNTTYELVITQEPSFNTVKLELNPTLKYQPVVGFGGMYNPVIWCGDNLITDGELDKMYGENGLGYSILRLMIYPNENDWSADVKAALAAQANGAVIFACPWDCTDALAETIQINGKDTKHLKPENYAAYADHLIRYVNYMKQQGVNLYAISMQNEPDMEFTYWKPEEVVEFLKQQGSRIRETGIKLMSPEACGMQPEYTDPVLNDAAAFAQTDIVAGHLYQGFIDLDNSYVKNRHDYICSIYPRLQGKTWWMTEHLFNDGEKEEDASKWQFRDWKYCLNHLGLEIHECLQGYCSAYVYWYLKRFYGLMGDEDQRSPVGAGEITKNGYIMAHYAQYASATTRVDVRSDNVGIKVTAFVNEDESEITLVILNLTDVVQGVQIPLGATHASAVATDEMDNMQPLNVEIAESGTECYAVLSANSITSVRLRL